MDIHIHIVKELGDTECMQRFVVRTILDRNRTFSGSIFAIHAQSRCKQLVLAVQVSKIAFAKLLDLSFSFPWFIFLAHLTQSEHIYLWAYIVW